MKRPARRAEREASLTTAWTDRLKRLPAAAREAGGRAIARFPVSVLVVVAFSLIANLLVADPDRFPEDEALRLLAALYAAALAGIGAVLGVEARAGGRSVRIAAEAAGAILAGTLVWFGAAWSVFSPALIGALLLAIPLVPFLGRGEAPHFWTFTAASIGAVTLSFCAVLLFVLGLTAIFEMIAFLFDVEIASGTYEHIYTSALSLVGPLFALANLPRRFDERVGDADSSDAEPNGLAALAGWVSAPLAIATAVVLYGYGLKIIVTGTVPKNEIGWIVSFFALLVVLLRLGADTFLKVGGAALALFARLWPWFLVLPLGLLAFAVWQRIAAEGVTVPRYYLALGGLAAALVALHAIASRRRPLDIRWTAGIPVFLLVLSSLGPVGVLEVTARSQTGRIDRLLASAQPQDGAPADLDRLSAGERAELRSRILVLDEIEQLARLASLEPRLPDTVPAEAFTGDADALIAALDLSRPEPLAERRSFETQTSYGVDLTGYDSLLSPRFAVPASAARSRRAEGEGSVPALALDGDWLVVTIGSLRDRFALKPVLSEAASRLAAEDGTDEPVPPVFDLRGEGGRMIRLVLHRWSLTGEGGVEQIETTVLYRKDEWR